MSLFLYKNGMQKDIKLQLDSVLNVVIIILLFFIYLIVFDPSWSLAIYSYYLISKLSFLISNLLCYKLEVD